MAIHTAGGAFFFCFMAIDTIFVERCLGIHRGFRGMTGIAFLGNFTHVMTFLATGGCGVAFM
jgi:hypothetical protein